MITMIPISDLWINPDNVETISVVLTRPDYTRITFVSGRTAEVQVALETVHQLLLQGYV